MKDIDWKTILVLSESKSISKAAEELFVTQSALTKRVKSIESEWNIELVKRSNQGIEFTQEGDYLVSKARIIMEQIEEAQLYFSNESQKKDIIRIGIPNSFGRLHMPKLIKSYMNDHDNLDIKTIANSSNVILQQLIDGNLDIGIICGDYPYAGEKTLLFEETLYIALPIDKTFDDLQDLTIIEPHLNPLVKKFVDNWWVSRFGEKTQKLQSVPYFEMALEMVENGLGACIIFGEGWRYDEEMVHMIPAYDVKGRTINRNVWMMMSDKSFESNEMMDFISFVENTYGVY